jgi:hypothetical protein
MVFTTEKIPYPLNFGIDLSNYINLVNSSELYNYIQKLEENQIDFLITPISTNDQLSRGNVLKGQFSEPIFFDDYLLFSYEWKGRIISKLHDGDLNNLNECDGLVQMDLDYSNHLCTKAISLNFPNYDSKNNFLFAKLLKNFLTNNPDRQVHIQVELSEQGWNQVNNLLTILGYPENLSFFLKMCGNVPEEVISFILLKIIINLENIEPIHYTQYQSGDNSFFYFYNQ